jgi:hypothetical protein
MSGYVMSDQDIGKKMCEEEKLVSFLDAYKDVFKDYISYSFGSSERPDFICYRTDGTKVGIELARIMRYPIDAQADDILDRKEFMDGEEAMAMLYDMIEEKEKLRQQPDWNLPNNTILVLQFVDCSISSLHLLDESLEKDFESYGFAEIWIADYTRKAAYGDIELFCLYPQALWGYYERSNPGRKPYG